MAGSARRSGSIRLGSVFHGKRQDEPDPQEYFDIPAPVSNSVVVVVVDHIDMVASYDLHSSRYLSVQ